MKLDLVSSNSAEAEDPFFDLLFSGGVESSVLCYHAVVEINLLSPKSTPLLFLKRMQSIQVNQKQLGLSSSCLQRSKPMQEGEFNC